MTLKLYDKLKDIPGKRSHKHNFKKADWDNLNGVEFYECSKKGCSETAYHCPNEKRFIPGRPKVDDFSVSLVKNVYCGKCNSKLGTYVSAITMATGLP